MGQQQLLLIILGVIVVGIAIAVGITQFGAQSTNANKDAVTSSLVALSSSAYEFKIRPRTLGGGSNSYVGYTIPSKMLSDDNGTYTLNSAPTATQVVFSGASAQNSAWIATMTVDSTGKTSIVYTGW
jgi:hypothetical protein